MRCATSRTAIATRCWRHGRGSMPAAGSLSSGLSTPARPFILHYRYGHRRKTGGAVGIGVSLLSSGTAQALEGDLLERAGSEELHGLGAVFESDEGADQAVVVLDAVD